MINQKWLDALESDHWIQHFGSLYNRGTYCALGLGAKVLGYKRNNSCFIFEDDFESEYVLSPTAMKRLGITRKQEQEIMTLNDGRCLTFKEIAKTIREW